MKERGEQRITPSGDMHHITLDRRGPARGFLTNSLKMRTRG